MERSSYISPWYGLNSPADTERYRASKSSAHTCHACILSSQALNQIIQYPAILVLIIFIIKANAQGELKCDFLCCSIFEKGDRDYETNQKARTLMKKERIHIPSNTTDILLDRLSAQTRPEYKTTDLSDNTEAKSDVSQ